MPESGLLFSKGCSSISSNVFVLSNTLGEEVAILVNGLLGVGNHQFEWNAQKLANGKYFYRLEAGGFKVTKSMILLK